MMVMMGCGIVTTREVTVMIVTTREVNVMIVTTREGHHCPPVTSEPDNHRPVAELGGSAITTLPAG